jgi:hypothetical protein
MILVVFFLLVWPLLFFICGGFWLAIALHLGSAALLATLSHMGIEPLRASRFADWFLGHWMRTHFDDESRAQLAALDATKQYIFVCEPHGQVPLHLCRFAGYGSAVPRALAQRTVVMASSLMLLLPFACQFFQMCGMVFAARPAVELALDRSLNVAACLSGLTGKSASMLRTAEQCRRTRDDGRHVVDVVQPERCGLLVLAVRRGLPIVPVLSPMEERAFWNVPLLGEHTPDWHLVLTLGNEWCMRPFCDVRVRVGAPIDTAALGLDANKPLHLHRLGELIYASMRQLAEPDCCVKLQ